MSIPNCPEPQGWLLFDAFCKVCLKTPSTSCCWDRWTGGSKVDLARQPDPFPQLPAISSKELEEIYLRKAREVFWKRGNFLDFFGGMMAWTFFFFGEDDCYWGKEMTCLMVLVVRLFGVLGKFYDVLCMFLVGKAFFQISRGDSSHQVQEAHLDVAKLGSRFGRIFSGMIRPSQTTFQKKIQKNQKTFQHIPKNFSKLLQSLPSFSFWSAIEAPAERPQLRQLQVVPLGFGGLVKARRIGQNQEISLEVHVPSGSTSAGQIIWTDFLKPRVSFLRP